MKLNSRAVNHYSVLTKPAYAGFAFFAFLIVFFLPSVVQANAFTETVAKVKKSLVAVGTVQRTRNPQFLIVGTGFVTGDGTKVVTNHHVIPKSIDHANREYLAVFTLSGNKVKAIPADLIKKDPIHDLALLEIDRQLPALSLAGNRQVADGSQIALSGFPIGMYLGLIPVTHQGMVSAYAPLASPPALQKDLTTSMIRALRNPFNIYQLDVTAFPGNSGSPVYDKDSGKVIAIVNSGFVSDKKEAGLSNPTGITYAIPVRFIHQLLKP